MEPLSTAEASKKGKNLAQSTASAISSDEEFEIEEFVAAAEARKKTKNFKQTIIAAISPRTSNEEKEARNLKEREEALIKCGVTVFTRQEITEAISRFNWELIGEGPNGRVYKGDLYGVIVAIKLMNDDIFGGSIFSLRQVAILSRLCHPNICDLMGLCLQMGALVYEFLPGGNLEDRLCHPNSEKPLTWQDCICIASSICSALLYLSSDERRGIVHGNLKPENILFDENDVIKLNDVSLPYIRYGPFVYDGWEEDRPRSTEIPRRIEIPRSNKIRDFGVILERLFSTAPEWRPDIPNYFRAEWPARLSKIAQRCGTTDSYDRAWLLSVWEELESIKKEQHCSLSNQKEQTGTAKVFLTEAGRWPYLQKVLHYLRKDSVSILGICGVGKSNLLRVIENYFLKLVDKDSGKRLFDHVIWVASYDRQGTANVRRTIAKCIGIEPLKIARMVNLQEMIFNSLKDKHFLLLIDDLRERLDLKYIGIPGPGDQNALRRHKHKIIFATDSKFVCSGMEAKTFELKSVSREEAWYLFLRNNKASISERFRERNLSKEVVEHCGFSEGLRIQNLQKEVVEHCGNLHLALVIASQALHAEEDPLQWEIAVKLLKNCHFVDVLGTKGPIFPLLRFSYDSLRDFTLQRCFLSCSFWPEDCSITKEELISCWMGLGLIDHYNDINEAYDRGYSFLEILQCKGLMEPGLDDEATVKMLDIVHDLAISIILESMEHRWVVRSDARHDLNNIEKWKAAELVSLMDNGIDEMLQDFVACRHLHSLMLNMNKIKRIPLGFFRCMKNLNYLDLSHTSLEELPSDIGLLDQLQYLNLSSTNIQSLPNELGKLQKLKYLFLRHDDIGKIPHYLASSLSSLLVFDAFPHATIDVDSIEIIKQNFAAIGMACFNVTILEKIQLLPIRWLRIRCQRGLSSLQLLGSTICESLQELEVNDCDDLEALVIIQDKEAEGIHYLRRLQVLRLMFLEELHTIIWNCIESTKCLGNLKILEISYCPKLQNITWAAKLPCLAQLSITDCDGMETMISSEESTLSDEDEAAKVAFVSLHVMELRTLPNLSSICDYKLRFPCLRSITISGCEELKCLPFDENTARNESLKIRAPASWWNCLEWESDEVRSSFENHFEY